MYDRPSTSQILAPSPRATTNGSPPTPRNARTGELTPPGKIARARFITSVELIDPSCLWSRRPVVLGDVHAPPSAATHEAHRALSRGSRSHRQRRLHRPI